MQPDYKNTLINPLGRTKDILGEVLATYERYKAQPTAFAQQFVRSSKELTCEAVWQYVKDNIRYVLDPVGVQLIKTPARTVADGTGDCKSYSILIASILYCLGIEHKFRFVGFKAGKPVTHVYIVALVNGKEVVLDACNTGFNVEAPYKTKIDKMTQISRLSGLPDYYYGDQPYIGKTIMGKILSGAGKVVGTAAKVVLPAAASMIPGVGPQASKLITTGLNAVLSTPKPGSQTLQSYSTSGGITDGFWRADGGKIYEVRGSVKAHVPNGEAMTARMIQLYGNPTWQFQETTSTALAPYQEVAYPIAAGTPASSGNGSSPAGTSSNTGLMIGGAALLAIVLMSKKKKD